MTTNFHIREVVAGAPDILPVTDEGRQNFVNDLSSWWGVLQSHVHLNVFLQEARFYDVPAQAGVDMGDPVLIHTFNSPGTSAANLLPPQVALSVTFKTQNRKRWGRSYMGGFTSLASDATGRITQPIMTDLATAYQHLTNRSGTGAALVVYSPLHRNHQDVDTIQVDDVFDVVRRRRYSTPLVRTTLDASP